LIRLLDFTILGYEVAIGVCDDHCSTCERMAHEVAERAWDEGSKKAVSLLYLTDDDNNVERHEVSVTRLITIPHPINEPF
jgi:hypothetical protein